MNSTTSPQLEPIVSLGAQVMALALVAALARGFTGGLFHRSIPREDLARIARRYGWWAARRAEASCPQNDVACVEREARRLFEVAHYRRR